MRYKNYMYLLYLYEIINLVGYIILISSISDYIYDFIYIKVVCVYVQIFSRATVYDAFTKF